jgi:Xaa-Pro aminopeptidase
MYTRVLLGNLSIERLLLNKNKRISGSQIDILARQYLMQIGEDYGHGTGHGVGHFLNVHEGPHSISPRSNLNLQLNMIVTNEPGYYLKDNFGIRIENILLIQNYKNLRDCLYFQNVTQVNYEPNLIEKCLLSKDMIDHINSYHHSVYQTLEKYLKIAKDDMALDYLRRKTKYL